MKSSSLFNAVRYALEFFKRNGNSYTLEGYSENKEKETKDDNIRAVETVPEEQ